MYIILNENYQGFLIFVEVGLKMAPGFGALSLLGDQLRFTHHAIRLMILIPNPRPMRLVQLIRCPKSRILVSAGKASV